MTLWTGRVLTAIPVLFLTFDAVIKLAKLDVVVESFEELGWSPDVARPIGVLLLACLVVHLVPRTAVIGPVYVAALVWGGLYLRDGRVKALASVVSKGEKQS